MGNRFFSITALLLTLTTVTYSQQLRVYSSGYLPGPDTVAIYTPAGGSTGKPLVVLLHGWSGNYRQWGALAGLQQAANTYGFNIACPDGFYSCWYANSPVQQNLQFESFFFGELLPALQEQLGYDTTNLFISGLSMGGFGALHLFAVNPGKFRAAGSTSGILDILPFSTRWGLEKVFGVLPEAREAFDQANPISNTTAIAPYGKPIIVDCGTEDFAFAVNKAYFEKAVAEKIPVTFIAAPGKHSAAYWSKSIQWQFQFFKEQQR